MPGSGSKGYQDAARESSARVRSAWTMGVEREALPTIRRMRREGATLHAIADALDARHCPPAAAPGCALEPDGRAADRPPARALT